MRLSPSLCCKLPVARPPHGIGRRIVKSRPSALTHRKIREYCDLRLAPILRPEEVGTLQRCLVGLLERAEYPPYRGSGLDVRTLAKILSMDESRLTAARSSLPDLRCRGAIDRRAVSACGEEAEPVG